MLRQALDVFFRLLKKSNKSRFDSYIVRNSVWIITDIIFRDLRVLIFPTIFQIAVVTINELFSMEHFKTRW